MCKCGHEVTSHSYGSSMCYVTDCPCFRFQEEAPVVMPGHNEWGLERAFPHLFIRESVDPDMDILTHVRDIYDACVKAGQHPEWTIGGMG